jgi:hypothetical protein
MSNNTILKVTSGSEITEDMAYIFYYPDSGNLSFRLKGSIVVYTDEDSLRKDAISEKLIMYNYYNNYDIFPDIDSLAKSDTPIDLGTSRTGVIYKVGSDYTILKIAIPAGIEKIIITESSSDTDTSVYRIILDKNSSIIENYLDTNRIFTAIKSSNSSSSIQKAEVAAHENSSYSHINQVKNLFYQVSNGDLMSANYIRLLSRINNGAMIDHFYVGFDLSKHWIGSYMDNE